MTDLVIVGANNQAVTSSLVVAEKFGKRHDHVIRDIENLIGGMSNFGETPQMFEKSTYIHEQNGQEYPMYLMNRDGFTMLAMGFTGKKAMQFKLDYMNAFNQMEHHIKEEQAKTPKALSQAQMLLQSAQLLVDIEQKQIEQSKEIETIKQDIQGMKDATHSQLDLFEELPLSENGVPEVTLRTQVKNAVALYAELTKSPNACPDYQFAWRFFYKEFQDRYHRRPVENKARKFSKIDWLEREGLLQSFYDLVSYYVKKENQNRQ